MFQCSQSLSAPRYVALSEIATVRAGLAFRTKLERDPAGHLRVVQAKDISENGTVDLRAATMIADQRGAKPHHLLKAGDVVFQSRGAAIRAGLVAESLVDTVAAAPLHVIRPKAGLVLPGFLVVALNMPTTIATLQRQARGSHIPQVPLEVVESLPLLLPDLDRQAAVVALAGLMEAEKRAFNEIGAQRTRLLEAVIAKSAGDTRRRGRAPG
jgi:Type I restriction modification DNA specificity domain